jgi:hypothetical protein
MTFFVKEAFKCLRRDINLYNRLTLNKLNLGWGVIPATVRLGIRKSSSPCMYALQT